MILLGHDARETPKCHNRLNDPFRVFDALVPSASQQLVVGFEANDASGVRLEPRSKRSDFRDVCQYIFVPATVGSALVDNGLDEFVPSLDGVEY